MLCIEIWFARLVFTVASVKTFKHSTILAEKDKHTLLNSPVDGRATTVAPDPSLSSVGT